MLGCGVGAEKQLSEKGKKRIQNLQGDDKMFAIYDLFSIRAFVTRQDQDLEQVRHSPKP
jgi:hypothetical protein